MKNTVAGVTMDRVWHITSPSASINESALMGEPMSRWLHRHNRIAGITAAEGGREVNAGWVIDTIVPREFLKTSMRASNYLANASIIAGICLVQLDLRLSNPVISNHKSPVRFG